MLEYTVCFIIGAMASHFLSYILSLGYSISVLKNLQKSCAALFLLSEQGLQEVLYIKYMTMEDIGRSDQNITAQKYIDQMNIDSVKKSIMRNYNSSFPSSYENIKEYSTWEEMEEYVNKQLAQGEKL
tara:strand:+ start:283 stop:663 length:381 start_codon:yes stop_codon:yes gene_type:complete